MSEERAAVISEVIRVVLTRRMTYAYQGIGEITLDILVDLDRLELEIADKGLPYWVDLEKELAQYPKGADQYRLKKLGREGQHFTPTGVLVHDVPSKRRGLRRRGPADGCLPVCQGLPAAGGASLERPGRAPGDGGADL